jgi:large subunit ribosomal protein L4e
MSTIRPVVSVYNHETGEHIEQVRYPHVLAAPIRLDVVHYVHTNLAKNARQAHGVDKRQGMKHSAASWGTGRAVARIPRVGGSGTNRSGQGAFGNQCRKGRMAHPLKSWRRIHRKVNIKQRRQALASALAATAVPAIVLSRGHRIMGIPQVPLVFDDGIGKIQKTKAAIAWLKKFGIYEDVTRVVESKTLRAGIGKLRNRRYRVRVGPLIIHGDECQSLVKAVRNIPGIETAHVSRLNVLRLAPGGHIGRFVIWTKSAFTSLNRYFGSVNKAAELKSGFHIQREVLTNSDIARIVNSDEIQKVVNKAKRNVRVHSRQKKNPLTNQKTMRYLNPYSVERRKIAQSITKTKKTVTKAEKKEKRIRSNASTKKVVAHNSELLKHSTQTIEEYNKIMADARYF